MAITNFIPTIWSENLISSLNNQYVGVANCNRDYEGEIKQRGSSVKICDIGDITVGDYTKDTDMNLPQELSDTLVELVIDKAKYFNFQVDDIDKTQCSPKLLETAMRKAANSLSNEADRYVYSLYTEAAHEVGIVAPGESIVEGIIKAKVMLYHNNVSNPDDVVIEIAPEVAAHLIIDQIESFSYNNDIITSGCIGTIAGSKVYVSNNIVRDEEDTFCCLVRSKRAIAFAEQLSEIEAYRPEKRFADAVKGLHLYGAKVVHPNEMVKLMVSVNTK